MVVNQVAGADFLNHFVFVGGIALFSVPRAKQNKALCALALFRWVLEISIQHCSTFRLYLTIIVQSWPN